MLQCAAVLSYGMYAGAVRCWEGFTGAVTFERLHTPPHSFKGDAMSDNQNPPQVVSDEQAIAELIRLREEDQLRASQVERELREEMRALWLRLPERRTAWPMIRRLFS